MSLKPLPSNFEEAKTWTWTDYEPHAKVLLDTTLSAETIDPWLDTWSQLQVIMDEVSSRLRIRTWRDTENQDYQTAFNTFIQDILSQWQSADAELRRDMSKRALKQASRFGWEKTAAQTLTAYRDVLTGAAGG